ncbi:MAG: tetratricopeptide repeat protein [Armatimonadetes bacterium]|nr:tetratricopeptide repeat protein [Armatimonadota bacterium]
MSAGPSARLLPLAVCCALLSLSPVRAASPPADPNASPSPNAQHPAPNAQRSTSEAQRPAPLTDWGRVIGTVFDAETEKPIPGARVTLLPPPGAARKEDKKLSGLSGSIGEYDLRAPLGQKKTKLHWGRLLMTNVLALANPRGVTTETRFVEVSSFSVRVEKDDYLPYEGPVSVADTRPERFAVYLRNVYLAPEGSERRSVAPDDRPREIFKAFTLAPAVAKPGEKVTFRAHFLLPNDLGINFRASAGGYRDLIPKEFGLPQVAAKKGDGLNVYFEKEVKIPAEPEDYQDRYTLSFSRDGRDVPVDAPELLLQVITDEADRPAAEALVRADELSRNGDYAGALDVALDAAKSRPGYRPAWLYASRLAVRLHRWDVAADAAKRVMDAGGTGAEEAYDTYAEAALESGVMTGAQLKEMLAPLEKAIPKKPKSRKERAEGYWNRAMGRAALAAGAYDDAALHFGKAALRIHVPAPLLQDLRVRQAEAAYAARPDASTRLNLARALLDAGRGTEALPHFRAAADVQPENPWVRLDLAEALLDEGQTEDALPELEKVAALSPENAEVQSTLGDTLFRLRRYDAAIEPLKKALVSSEHNGDLRLRYGAALYASGREEKALEELAHGSQLLRAKPEVRDDLTPTPWGVFFTTPKRRSAAGFQTLDARHAHRLLRAHERLAERPDDPDARIDAAMSLAGLGAYDSSLRILAKLPPARADSPPVLRVRAMAEEAREDWTAARKTWRAVMAAAPEDTEARRHTARIAAMLDGPDAARLALNADLPMTPDTLPEGRMTLWD